ncbi:hypothetical protein FSP39_011328 [Pinctada imbricata]|uniref:Uncharacterized protein n=1 Tax=Pinctada imbricata TaxID=66713 RepID=A0AA88YST5_PINIB|nr:hypothetical protein FSP39_011328 [Pinctada imbricata]
MPAVKLGRREKTRLDNSFSSVRSPNTVRIAPPDPHKLSSPRLFKVKPTNSNESRRAPDTQAVVTALKEKSRKRALDGTELTFQEIPNQLAKRRRQESQQSNASTSSLPPLPDSLPDLSTSGYSVPRVKTPVMKQHEDTPPLKHPANNGENTPSLKRTANMTDLTEADQEEHVNKRAKTDPSVHNSLVSSLSSSRKIRQQTKRKVTLVAEEKENNKTPNKKTARFEKAPIDREPSNSSLQKADTVIIPPDFDETRNVSLTNGAASSKEVTIETTTPPKPSIAPKMVSLNETFSARKRQMSFYSGLNESLKKVSDFPPLSRSSSLVPHEKMQKHVIFPQF